MKKQYKKPKIMVVKIADTNIICTSNPTETYEEEQPINWY